MGKNNSYTHSLVRERFDTTKALMDGVDRHLKVVGDWITNLDILRQMFYQTQPEIRNLKQNLETLNKAHKDFYEAFVSTKNIIDTLDKEIAKI